MIDSFLLFIFFLFSGTLSVDVSTAAGLISYFESTSSCTGTVTLTNDIDFAGITLTYLLDEAANFSGTFDGAGHAITNLGATSLFFRLGDGAVVKNLVFDKSCEFSGSYAASVATQLTGKVTVDNVVSNGNVTATYAGGGIIASVNDEGVQVTITHSTNDGDVICDADDGDCHAGGVIGELGYAARVKIADSTNNGSVSVINSGDHSISGGLVGGSWDYQFSGELEVTNCTNHGNVESTGRFAYASGVVGRVSSELTDTMTITNCTNSGSVDASSTSYYSYAGGIVGYLYVGISCSSTVANCTNIGSLTAIASSDYSLAGGIVGYLDVRSGTDAAMSMTNCTNSGSVDAIAYSWAYVGGVVGYLDVGSGSSSTIINCHNMANLSSSGTDSNVYAGGIVGIPYGSGSFYIESCSNIGEIASNESVCGIVCRRSDTSTSITVVNSANHGILHGFAKYAIGNFVTSATNVVSIGSYDMWCTCANVCDGFSDHSPTTVGVTKLSLSKGVFYIKNKNKKACDVLNVVVHTNRFAAEWTDDLRLLPIFDAGEDEAGSSSGKFPNFLLVLVNILFLFIQINQLF